MGGMSARDGFGTFYEDFACFGWQVQPTVASRGLATLKQCLYMGSEHQLDADRLSEALPKANKNTSGRRSVVGADHAVHLFILRADQRTTIWDEQQFD